jgi:L-fucose mutarotase
LILKKTFHLYQKFNKGVIAMINTEIIHPEILKALAGAGHGSTILIADGNFPSSTAVAPEVPRVYLNFA